MRTPTVDVVIDNFDYSRFLGTAIESALGQTYPQTRVTVVDDGSTDDSLDVARGYGDRIRLITKANGGQASALNAGAAATDGDIVAFLDADDALCPDFAATAVEVLSSKPDAARVIFRAQVIDSAGTPTGRVEPSPHLPLSAGDLRGRTMSHAFDLVWPPLSAQVFRRSVLAAVLPIPEDEFRTLADWYLAHTTSLLGDVVAVERAGAQYRLHGANAYLLDGAGDGLAQVRTSIVHAEHTMRHVGRIAAATDLAAPRRPGASSAAAARRLISLRLDPARHPLEGDARARAWADGARSLRGRPDLPPRVRAALLAWFTLASIVPRPLVRRLSQPFLHPERRGRVGRRVTARR